MSWWSGDKPRRASSKAKPLRGKQRRKTTGKRGQSAKRPVKKTAAARKTKSFKKSGAKHSGLKTGVKRASGRSRAQSRNGVRRVRANQRGRAGLTGFLGVSLYWSTVAAIWAMLAFGGLIFYYSATLPDPLIAGLENSSRALKILAKDGSLIAERGLARHYVRLSSLPRAVPQAVIAIEDRRFYHHFWFDPIGFARAMFANLRAGQLVQGGSTLTQQLAKNLFLTSERTLSRKLQEMGMAFWLETRFSKEQILELYLNRVYFGHKAYGIDPAARRYFGKQAKDLDLSEAAMLAGLLKAPSRLNPRRDRKAARLRAGLVLHAMVKAGFISPLTAKTASLTPARIAARSLPINSNYIADWIAELVPEYISDFSSDLVIKTTIDPALQLAADTSVRDLLKARGKRGAVSQAAVIMLAPNGAVRAMVGGRDYQKSQFNRAIHGKRQTGSVFKPIVYLTALEAGFSPLSEVYDQPTRFHNWQPKNYKNKYHGAITLRHALSVSSNVVAVKLMGTVGVRNTIETARRLGLKGEFSKNLSLALGTTDQTLIDMTAAYAPFANGGRGVMPFIIRSIKTRSGKSLYQGRGLDLGQVATAGHVNEMNDMLRGVVKWGTGKQARIGGATVGHDFAGKTGTSQKFRDGWFIGYSSYYVTGVWVGNDNGRPMRQVTGGGLPAMIWSRLMSQAHAGLAPHVMTAYGDRPVERHGWRKVGLARRIKPQLFEKLMD